MKRKVHVLLAACLVTAVTAMPVFGASSHGYGGQTAAGVSVSYVTMDMKDSNIKPVTMMAGGNMVSAQSVASMAQANGAFAAINGTYFSAYDGHPVPYGTLIRDGKLIHNLNSGAVAGITADGRLLVDRLSVEFAGYINGVYRAIPWRINHPSTEPDAITIFTEDYGAWVPMPWGSKAAVIQDGKVVQLATDTFPVPKGGFAIVYNSNAVDQVNERYKVGDSVFYTTTFKPQSTSESDWKQVTTAVGAGPSLLINGQVTADGAAEGFTEAKINTNWAGRSFIGSTADGKIVIGTMKSATLKEAAAACQAMGMTNAMCLDGGGSVGLYYNGSVKSAGRAVNNALGFVYTNGTGNGSTAGNTPAGQGSVGINAQGAVQTIYVDETQRSVQAYTISDSNYFKLRDIAVMLNGTASQFDVQWDESKGAINLVFGQPYSGNDELKGQDWSVRYAAKSNVAVYVKGKEADMDAYTIADANYFKLRDVGLLMGFDVQWDEATNAIRITSSTPNQKN